MKHKAMPDYTVENDARTLTHAQEIMSDKKRHAKAKKHLSKMADEKSQEATHANAAKGLKRAFPEDQNTNPDQQNSGVSAPVTKQANSVKGQKQVVEKINAVPPLRGTSVGGY